jgi:hypothetical protein
MLYAWLTPSMLATCPVHLILLDMIMMMIIIIIIISAEEHTLRGAALRKNTKH